MACEAGREERGPKVRDPSPLDLHWSNLEGGRKEVRQEGGEKEITYVTLAAGAEGNSPQLCYRGDNKGKVFSVQEVTSLEH